MQNQALTAENHVLTAEQKQLFSRGSTTYYNATRFFPRNIRDRVTRLYAFVRKVDNFVDSLPQQREAFEEFYAEYRIALESGVFTRVDPVIVSFILLLQEIAIDPEWIEAFFHSMRMDLYKRCYNTLDELIGYMYGSAEVIGLCMARIMKLPEVALRGARMLGRSMQYINFIRDIAEDNSFGRCYLSISDQKFESLLLHDTENYPQAFVNFLRRELKRFVKWQLEAEQAFSYLPIRYRVAIKTASDMYMWTARQVYKNPWIVYSGSVKPHKIRIIICAFSNIICVLVPLLQKSRDKKFFSQYPR